MASVRYEPEAQRDPHELRESLKRRWELSDRLLEKVSRLKHDHSIHGIQRVERKIVAEKAFLESVRNFINYRQRNTSTTPNYTWIIEDI